ncbi:hypothetical protein [Mycolicibacterium arseniciresistens]|uniref:Uncharacterized protein n=1 Tax=Mycolicibacterium arseniciresistens TaxID=3062257 RepID=A0ABT8UJ64_9MYCO|nr:hypothetical protein [Mycolicibacterium arseniciresistens]MDO3637832.1 hypothetical protein [Mycolicibacterium arseniciresistens]
MSTLSRLRDVQRRILKAQRRIWLLQASLWVTLVLTGVSAVVGAAWWLSQRRTDTSEAGAASRDTVNPATNGQLTHTGSRGDT